MNRAIANLMRIGGVSLRDAIRTATVNPARLIGFEGRGEGLKIGERGDVVVFRLNPPAATTASATLAIEAVYLDGGAVYLAGEAVHLDGIRVA